MQTDKQILTIKISYSETRIKDFFRFHLSKKSGVNELFWTLSTICLIIGFIFIFYNNRQLAFFLFFIAVILWPMRSLMIKIGVNRLMNKARPFSRQYILIFTDDTIIYQTESICHEYKLEDLNKVYETINYFYFYIHRSKAIVLPQNMMTTAEKNKINYMLTDKNISIRKFNFK